MVFVVQTSLSFFFCVFTQKNYSFEEQENNTDSEKSDRAPLAVIYNPHTVRGPSFSYSFDEFTFISSSNVRINIELMDNA